ncbi:hypothetical protein Ahia01_000958800, partial [Argonauta hians]
QQQQLKLHFPNDEDYLILNLTSGVSVLHPEAAVSFHRGDNEEPVYIGNLESCYLTGHITSHEGLATFSYCGNKLEGAMMVNNTEILVKGLSEPIIITHRRSITDQPFLLARRQINYSTNYITTKEDEIPLKESPEMFRRTEHWNNNYSDPVIEIAVYVDSVLTNALETEHNLGSLQEKINFVVIKYNAVQLEYRNKRLTDLNITIQLKKIVFFTENAMENFKVNNLDSFLNSFCSWQRFNVPKYDHVMLLSIRKSADPGGRAYRPGVCHQVLHCAVNNQVRWGFWFLEAHELGHNLGMYHSDETAECKTPPASDGVMGTRRTGWSTCSRQAFLELIRNVPHSRRCV